MSIPIFPGRYKPPRIKPRTCDARRIKRRARELAMEAELRYIELMEKDLQQGELASESIEWWEPQTTVRVKQLLEQAQKELHLARGVAQVLFP